MRGPAECEKLPCVVAVTVTGRDAVHGQAATKFIRQSEGYDRGFFGGPVPFILCPAPLPKLAAARRP